MIVNVEFSFPWDVCILRDLKLYNNNDLLLRTNKNKNKNNNKLQYYTFKNIIMPH